MHKRLAMLALAFLTVAGAKAQFESGKKYVNASLTSLDFSYNGLGKGNFGLQASGGYLFADDLLAEAHLAYEKQHEIPHELRLGVGARYYIIQNGLYLGVSADYVHQKDIYEDFMPGVHVGYAFFLNGTVTIEPEFVFTFGIVLLF